MNKLQGNLETTMSILLILTLTLACAKSLDTTTTNNGQPTTSGSLSLNRIKHKKQELASKKSNEKKTPSKFLLIINRNISYKIQI